MELVPEFDFLDISMNKKLDLQRGTMESHVRAYFADIPAMVEIARCESNFRQYEKSGVVLQGRVDKRDTGVMQINRGYHGAAATNLGLDLDKPEDNMAYAKFLYKKQGLQPWMSSYPCWGTRLPHGIAVK
jgi:hypothetical protein